MGRLGSITLHSQFSLSGSRLLPSPGTAVPLMPRLYRMSLCVLSTIKNLVPSLPCNTKSSLALRFIVVITHLGDKTLHNICVVRCVEKSQHDGMTVPSSPLCKCFPLHRRRDMASVMASRAIYKYYVLGVLTASFICSEGGTRC